jgi:hypothetical protein
MLALRAALVVTHSLCWEAAHVALHANIALFADRFVAGRAAWRHASVLHAHPRFAAANALAHWCIEGAAVHAVKATGAHVTHVSSIAAGAAVHGRPLGLRIYLA